MFDNSASVPLELLRFPRPFSQSSPFDAALRRRIEELRDFTHPSAPIIRSIQWLGVGDGLALVSNQVTGRRLADAFGQARGPAYAMELLRQLTDFLAALERHGPGISHGAINADRVVITETGRLVVVEHVLGAALATLYWPPSRTRAALDLPMLGSDKSAFDNRTDVYQLAFLALSVTLGRRVHPTDDPGQGAALLAEAGRPGLTRAPISARLRHWLMRALQLENGFTSAAEAHDAFEHPTDDQPELRPAPPIPLPRMPESERPIPAPRRAKASVTRMRPREAASRIFASARAAAGRAADTGEHAADASPAAGAADSGRRLASLGALLRPTGAWLVPGLVVVIAVQTVAIGILAARARIGGPAAPASILVDAAQPGTPVLVDGRAAGVTPLRLDIASTTKSIRLQQDLAQAPAPTITAPAAVAAGTAMDITSDPPGAHVTIDGKAAGETPLVAPTTPGAHEVVVSNGSGAVSRTVTVGANATATVMAALAPPGGGAGWVTIASPIELQVLENNTVIGTTTAAKLMLPAGRHDLIVASTALGFQAPLRVDVLPGRSVLTTVSVPNGSVSINALPWATVTLDGRDLGTTPVANVDVPLGNHDVVLRHPQLGDRRQTITVTAKSPVRLVVDLNKK